MEPFLFWYTIYQNQLYITEEIDVKLFFPQPEFSGGQIWPRICPDGRTAWYTCRSI